ncbi:nitroreductase family protein [Iodobacter sp. CM08]|uniref:nitroreductase family protein n=1 Tax=Iodobacter sp. CM08 TaxID=3085902 RepID=UPI0029820E73|nr:nitroreductase family protein [Iodobacter sp. CM08]MDW5417424.1 nitroreductase family protein [Iodobacter sp. CM08]
MNLSDLIENRSSTSHYDASKPLTDSQITELMRLATLAPSAYHFQNWKLIAVRSSEAKTRLKDIAFGQNQVEDAAVTFIICGSLMPHQQLAAVLRPSLDTGALPQQIVDSWVSAANSAYADNPQLQRDEAIRSASLAAMTLILAAEGMGLSTGTIGGFDTPAMMEAFALKANEIPVILVTAGYAGAEKRPQKPRRPLSEVVELV